VLATTLLGTPEKKESLQPFKRKNKMKRYVPKPNIVGFEHAQSKKPKITMICSVCNDACFAFYQCCEQDHCRKVFCSSCSKKYDNILCAKCDSCSNFCCSNCISFRTDDCTFLGCHDCYMTKHECQAEEKSFKVQRLLDKDVLLQECRKVFKECNILKNELVVKKSSNIVCFDVQKLAWKSCCADIIFLENKNCCFFQSFLIPDDIENEEKLAPFLFLLVEGI
jgi:hypothetical protein